MENVVKAGVDPERQEAPFSDGELIQRLHLRAADCRQKSMTARLAAVIDWVEALLARGYDRSQVRDLLVEAGWRFTPDSFDSALTRVRKRRSAIGSRISGGGKLGPSLNAESAMSGDTSARGNQPVDASFSDTFVEREGSLPWSRWK
ncbi:hypothetical protein CNECB9_930014 [Cupriavidus necator]|uniref:Uncharacterized protein n=1 Tax=Cupriavidus necator TaxID=106590 RepID=A0A1K0J4E5_CUPNE|nr:hypothetical protein CNECB9_930014 [Cupriavidus necator]